MKVVAKDETPDTKASTGGSVSYLSVVLVAVACIIVGIAFVAAESAIQEAALFALAAVAGILARIAQAQKHHSEIMDKLDGR